MILVVYPTRTFKEVLSNDIFPTCVINVSNSDVHLSYLSWEFESIDGALRMSNFLVRILSTRAKSIRVSSKTVQFFAKSLWKIWSSGQEIYLPCRGAGVRFPNISAKDQWNPVGIEPTTKKMCKIWLEIIPWWRNLALKNWTSNPDI